ncbi:RNA-directed DNA polymerase, eukaryota, Reverse transcriptase zinc-binding domain protein [Artemisia annua]|uniref:RNA-directed DNA polymerase, eukaryota, Reverse transcriptase zinc-binding domain protein n=1 Tax=Artemisia annua TaxID=35608 RepID=A0A2U1KEW1_ARTAN|nr:RNA-directed DNA polymerase, eukaryota, Reverse transcriptase zinc-binding domain protein [Artemisia annua]
MSITVGEMIDNGRWKWPLEWYDKFPLITSIEDPFVNDNAIDKVVWVSNNGEEGDFSVKGATTDLCNNNSKVHWWKLVWFSQCIPKHSFILWLAIQDRLSTQEKLMKWGIYTVNRCPLCLSEVKNPRINLFLACGRIGVTSR